MKELKNQSKLKQWAEVEIYPIFWFCLMSESDLVASECKVSGSHTLLTLMRKCGKEVTIWLVCFHFFSRCSMSVSFLSHTSSWERGCSCEMMKFQGKVDVPSITGGGKVQINHLISPAFSPLSWGSRARGKSINLHKWDMTQRSLCLYTGLCTYLTLALTLYYCITQTNFHLASGGHDHTRCKNIQ